MKLNREILRLAVPSILAGITVPLVGMVDIAVAGHLGDAALAGGLDALSGAAFIGGISIGTMLFDLLYWNFAFLRAGTAGLTAQAFGRVCASEGAGVHGGAAEDGRRVPEADGAHGAVGNILWRALRIALLSGVALIALQWVVVQLAFLVVQCSPQVQALATRYFYIRIWAAPATLSLFAFKGWFIGLQDSIRPMTADFLVNGLNILLSVALGFGVVLPVGDGAALAGGIDVVSAFSAAGGITLLPRLGLDGVALGTVIAQWSGFLYCVLAARRRYRPSLIRKPLRIKHFRISIGANSADRNQQRPDSEALPNQANLSPANVPPTEIPSETVTSTGTFPPAETAPDSRAYFALNRDLIVRALGMIAVYIGFTVLSARYGDLMLAVSTILMKLLMIFSYFTDGFAYAGEALTGRFIGERNEEGVRSTVRGTFAWSLGVAGFFILLYWLGGVPLLRLMTSDQSVVEAGRSFLPWLLLMPLIGCPAFTWDGIFIGATASKDLRNSTVLCAVGFFAAWFIGLAFGADATPESALHLLMAAYFVHLAVRTVYLTARYRSGVLSANGFTSSDTSTPPQAG